MFNRTLLAISLSTFMIGSAYAQSLVEQPLTVQTPSEPLAPLKIEIKQKPATPVAEDAKTATPSATDKKKSFFKKKEKAPEQVKPEVKTSTPLEPIVAPEIKPKAATVKQVAPKASSAVLAPIATAEPVKAEVAKKVESTKQAIPEDDVIQPLEDILIDDVPSEDETPVVKEPVQGPKTTDKGAKTVTALTLQSLNNAQYSKDLSGLALKAFTAKAQVLLDNAHTTPGAIDGQAGNKMSKAIRAFQIIHKLEKSNTMNQATWNKLVQMQGKTPAFVEYTITANDVNKNLYVSGIPDSYEEKSKMSGLKYTRITEMLGEKFHLDENFLRELNPNAKFVAGEKIIVPNVHGNLPEDISVIIAMKEMKQVYLFNSKNQMVGSFPATVGKETSPSPSGTLKVTRIAKNPWYTKPGEKSSLPAGPNTPVGNVWIALSKPSYGIHGTPEPSKISNDGQGSAGCVRLTNWDANRLATAVKPGVTVIFRDDSIKK